MHCFDRSRAIARPNGRGGAPSTEESVNEPLMRRRDIADRGSARADPLLFLNELESLRS
jgi:hypothetical protein